MSQVEVDKIIPQSGTTLTIGDSGDTITIPSGVTLSNSGIITNFESTGIDDNATSTAITIDSSQRVGIGTASPVTPLNVIGGSDLGIEVSDTSGNGVITIKGNATNGGSYLQFGDTDDDNVGRVYYTHNDNAMKFNTADAERMRINSSGNLLVGKTSQGSDAVGVENRGDGLGIFTRDGNTPVIINRKTSDGTVIDIKKDGTTLGSIGNDGNNLIIEGKYNTSKSGLEFPGDALLPRQNSARADNAIDVGTTSSRFRDIYIGGGLYVGGTAAANKLDDYEEGTWTPTLDAYAGTPSFSAAQYVKIGKIVYGAINVQLDGTSDSSHFRIRTLPFSVGLTTSVYGGFVTYTTGTNNKIYVLASDGGNSLDLYTNDGNVLTYNGLGSSAQIRIAFFYEVN